MSGIEARLREVRQRILATGKDVRLVAVSKTHPAEAIRVAYGAGQRDFGENYVQELAEKATELEDLRELRWHMIGHLQRNKARVVVRHASVIHTIDTIRLAEELGKRAETRLSVLVEVNVAGETQKSGCKPSELESLLEAIEGEEKLALNGLMTVPPISDKPEDSRPFFDRLVELREVNGGARRLPELSMGMTHDLEQAIAAGATIVRVGTAIFGPRGT